MRERDRTFTILGSALMFVGGFLLGHLSGSTGPAQPSGFMNLLVVGTLAFVLGLLVVVWAVSNTAKSSIDPI